MRALKAFLSVLLSVIMLLSMAACGGDQTPETTDPVGTTAPADGGEATEPTEPQGFEVQTKTCGNFEISVLGAERILGRSDVPAIRIYYQYTNNASYTAKAINDLDTGVTQNGETIDTVFAADDIPEDYYKELYVRPGATIRCTTVRELADETSPVTFTVGDYVTKESIEVEFDLANLPGAPAEAFEITPMTDPQSLAGLAAEGTLDEKYAVKITGVEKTEDRSGNPALVVHYSYTNNSDEALRFISAVKAKVFQDGIQLDEGIPSDVKDPAYKMKNEKCEVGQTVEVDMYFELRSTSPCEVEVCDSHITMATDEYFEERIGLIYTVE